LNARTLIYLDPSDLKALRAEARSQGISVAELMRRVVRTHISGQRATRRPSQETYMKLVGLGSRSRQDISEHHDVYLAEALRREHSC